MGDRKAYRDGIRPALNRAALFLFALAHVQHEFVVHQLIAMGLDNFPLQGFDAFVHKLGHDSGIYVDHVVVVLLVGQFVYRMAIVEVVSIDDSRGLELGKDPINRRQPDRIVRFEQVFVDVLGAQMVRLGAFQHLQDLEPRQGHLETRIFQILLRHGRLR